MYKDLKISKISEELYKELETLLLKAGCKNLIIKKFEGTALGLTVDDTIYINNTLLNSTIEIFVSILLHEAAHCHQFKKYGKEAMYQMFLKDMDHDKASEYIKNMEVVADDYSYRMIRVLKRKKLISKNFYPMGFHKHLPTSFIKLRFEDYKLKMGNVDTPEQVIEFFTNQI